MILGVLVCGQNTLCPLRATLFLFKVSVYHHNRAFLVLIVGEELMLFLINIFVCSGLGYMIIELGSVVFLS